MVQVIETTTGPHQLGRDNSNLMYLNAFSEKISHAKTKHPHQ